MFAFDSFAPVSQPIACVATVPGGRSFERSGVAFDGSRQTQMVPTVAQAAGLGRFCYLLGASGRRYVFSLVEAQRAQSRANAVFALRDETGRVTFSLSRPEGPSGGLHIHLLDEDADRMSVLNDLKATVA